MLKSLLGVLLLLWWIPSNGQQIDVSLLESINRPNNKTVTDIASFTTASTYPIGIGIAGGLLLTGLLKQNHQLVKNGWTLSVAIGTASLVAYTLKKTVQRTRPFLDHSEIMLKTSENGTNDSFPSGHSTFAFATATTLSLQYPKWYIIIPSYSWAMGVGWSRLYQGVHYPSDILIGALIGTSAAWLTHIVNKKLNVK